VGDPRGHAESADLSPLRQSRVGATIVHMTVEPLRDVRNHFSDVIDRVQHEHERVTVTRNGRPVAVILSPDDLAELEETLTVLSDQDALADIREADAAFTAGDVVRGVDGVRALRS
jgi:antitoxin YefM